MLLFLDFDGVLHPISGSATFNTESIGEIEAVIDHFPTLEIVITSSWREGKSLDELATLLGQKMSRRVIGTTPIINDPFLHFPRYHEVCAYLETVIERDRQWVAVDDEPGNYPKEAPVVIVNRRTGFTHDDREKLIAKILAITSNLPTI